MQIDKSQAHLFLGLSQTAFGLRLLTPVEVGFITRL